MYNIPKDKQTLLFTHIRLAHGFSNHKKRLQAVQARLHAISILGEHVVPSQPHGQQEVLTVANADIMLCSLPCSVLQCAPGVRQQYTVQWLDRGTGRCAADYRQTACGKDRVIPVVKACLCMCVREWRQSMQMHNLCVTVDSVKTNWKKNCFKCVFIFFSRI